VLDKLESALKELDRLTPDGKAAVTGEFEAAEILFKLMVKDTKCQRLGSDEITKFLGPIFAAQYQKDEPATRSAHLLAGSFGKWVDAVHFQRHGQPVEEPYRLSLDLAIALLQAGMAWIRWLAMLDRARQAASLT
jgi:hypothetical protein